MKIFILCMALVLLNSCAVTHKRTIDSVSEMETPDGVQIVEGEDVEDSELTPSPKEEDEEVVTEKFQDSNIVLKSYPDIPHSYNKHVQLWLDYFQGRGKSHMQKYLERSGKYLPIMQKILKENGLPEDLVYIALIESGFGFSARSHAGAVGYWQFIRETGRRYDLEINSLIDDRRDPIKSTHAAVKYFRSLYNVFGNWYFAFAAYNGGENRMFRVLMKHDSRDFWTIAETRLLPKETRNYIPKYLAARMIAKNPERYGFNSLDYQKPVQFSEIVASQSVNLRVLANELGVEFDELKYLNPTFVTEFAPIRNKKSITLRIPQGLTEKAPHALASAYITDSRLVAAISKTSSDVVRYRVRRGDNLGKIARKHGTTISQIRKLNRLGNKSFLRVGQVLKVPEKVNPRQLERDLRKLEQNTRQATQEKRGSKRVVKRKQHYVVRRGDTLLKIALKHKVSLSRLLAANELKKSSTLHTGAKLIIPD